MQQKLIGILYSVYVFIGVYFSLSDGSNKNVGLLITIAGTTHSLQWRSIALSCISNVTFFLVAQLWNNLRKYDKINAIPLDVKIVSANATDLDSMYDLDESFKVPKVRTAENKDTDTIETSSKTTSNNNTLSVKKDKIKALTDSPSIGSIQRANKMVPVNDVIEKMRTITQSKGSFEVKVPFEITLTYMILIKLCKFPKQKAFRYSQFLLQKEFVWVLLGLLILINIFFQIFVSKFSIGVTVFLLLVQYLLLLIVVGNVSFSILYFKRRSLPVIYKLGSIFLLYLAELAVDYKFGMDTFDRSGMTTGYVIFIVFFVCSSLLWIGLIVSLLHGYHVAKAWKLGCVLALVAIVSNDSIPFYFSTHDRVFHVFNQTVSSRAVVIGKGFDIVVWFLYQFYQIWKYPTSLRVVGKIHATWVD